MKTSFSRCNKKLGNFTSLYSSSFPKTHVQIGYDKAQLLNSHCFTLINILTTAIPDHPFVWFIPWNTREHLIQHDWSVCPHCSTSLTLRRTRQICVGTGNPHRKMSHILWSFCEVSCYRTVLTHIHSNIWHRQVIRLHSAWHRAKNCSDFKSHFSKKS